jgi:hypothetical protein
LPPTPTRAAERVLFAGEAARATLFQLSPKIESSPG